MIAAARDAQVAALEDLRDWFNDIATTLREAFSLKERIQLGLTLVKRTASGGTVVVEEGGEADGEEAEEAEGEEAEDEEAEDEEADGEEAEDEEAEPVKAGAAKPAKAKPASDKPKTKPA